MGYPRRLLDDSEEIVFDLHPHWKVMFGPVLTAVATVFAASFLSAKAPEGSRQGLVRLVVFVIAVGVIVMFAVVPFARSGRDIPLFRVNDVTFGHSMWERLFGAGTLTVESAGERGQVTLSDIPHVEAVQRELYRLVEMHENRRSGELRARSEDPSYDTQTAGYRYADGTEPTRRLPRPGPDDSG